MVRDYLDRALLDTMTVYRDILMVQSSGSSTSSSSANAPTSKIVSTDGFDNNPIELINVDLLADITRVAATSTPQATLKKIEAIQKARTNLSHNAAPLLTIEAMMVQLK
jgi:DNA polymerase-3 subunit delta'